MTRHVSADRNRDAAGKRYVRRRLTPDYVAERDARLAAVNELVTIIAYSGRGFFRTPGKATAAGGADPDRIAYLYVDASNRVFFVDDGSGAAIMTHSPTRWEQFTHGGTLRGLVVAFRDFIRFGARLPVKAYFGPWPAWLAQGDLWGYGPAAMARIRAAALDLGIADGGAE